MIYITGDCHQNFERFSMSIFPEQKEMTKDDFVIICGDFGGVWNKGEESKEEIRTALKTGLYHKCDVDKVIDEYLLEEAKQIQINLNSQPSDEDIKNAVEQDPAEAFNQVMDIKRKEMEYHSS